MREAQETTIDGYSYRVKPMGAFTGNKVLMRIGKAIFPAVKDAGSLATLAGAIQAITGLMGSLSEADMLFVVQELADVTRFWPEGEESSKAVSLKNVFDSHFAGRYSEQWEWITFSLGVNYSFLAELRQKMSEAASPLEAKAPEP